MRDVMKMASTTTNLPLMSIPSNRFYAGGLLVHNHVRPHTVVANADDFIVDDVTGGERW